MNDKIKILHVEDNILQAKLIENQLASKTSETYEIHHVKSIHEAIQSLDQHDFKIILLDLQLQDSQGLSGFHLLHNKNKLIPIVILSSNDDEILALEAIIQGAEDFLVKEMNVGSVLSRSIRYAIERKKIKRELNHHKNLLEMKNKDLRESQSKLLHTEKMAGIGQLAAGVAHEINNPVGFVTSNLSSLKDYCTSLKNIISIYDKIVDQVKGDEPSEDLQALINDLDKLKQEEDFDFIKEDISTLIMESLDGTNRIKDIVQNLKSFARIDDNKIHDVDINQCIKTTLKFVWNELKYKCTVHENYTELPIIKGFPGQLNQVFMNLLVNASHAIPEKGEIFISTFIKNQDIVITIKDTGSGIDPKHMSKLFDPFFTTKPVGKGTGLGLSISYGIIEKHKGKIEVESTLTKGTTFKITLPIDSTI